MSSAGSSRSALAFIPALGIVFGDLGTSPLYALQECFAGAHGADAAVRADVLGTVSLIFWSLTVVVTVKYLVFLMRIDNRGEGGILALLALLPGNGAKSPPLKILLGVILAVVGASLLFGDGVITPAVSVLSAVEGLGVATDTLKDWVVPITIVILVGLFAVQSRGTEKLARYFGPIMLVWFLVAFVLGLRYLVRDPSVLEALSPVPAIRYFARHGLVGIRVLGGVVLAVTGGEALYADMGHFGRAPIQRAWIFVCLPSLVVSYLGQAAFVLANPAEASHPFFSMCPRGPVLYAVVAIAAAATVIASQALISGVFSLTHQAIQLGLFPRLTVKHTSASAEGQIYIPAMNTFLAAACIAIVVGFRESGKLAAAFGLAVSGTMAITSILFFLVVRNVRNWNPLVAWALLLGFLAFDVPFVVANSLKLLDGGWLPLLLGAFFTGTMLLWRRGRRFLADYFADRHVPIETFVAELESGALRRLPGVGVFFAARAAGTPLPLVRIVGRFRAAYDQNVLLTVITDPVSHVRADERAEIEPIAPGVLRIILHFGFMENPAVVAELDAALATTGIASDPANRVYLLGRETITPSDKGRMGRIQEGLFAFMSRNAKSPTDWFSLPPDQVVEVGAQVDL